MTVGWIDPREVSKFESHCILAWDRDVVREQKSSRAQDLLVRLRFVRLNPCVSGYAKAQAWHGGKALHVSPGGSAFIQWDDLGTSPKDPLFVELTRVEWPMLDRNARRGYVGMGYMRLSPVIICVSRALRYRRIHRDFMPLLMPYVLISSSSSKILFTCLL